MATEESGHQQAPCFVVQFISGMQQFAHGIQPSDWQRYRRLLTYVRPYRGRLLAGMAMLAAVSLVEPLIQVAFRRF